MKLLSKALFIICLASLAATFGLGFSYSSFITPLHSKGELSGIHSDRWLEDGATLTLNNLASRGNRLLISLNTWRPIEPAIINVSVCGNPASSFTVSTDEPYTIFLTGECQPRIVKFKVENPIPPKQGETRKLGSQVNFLKVTSRLGVPIVSTDLLLKGTIVIALISGLASYFGLLSLFIVPILSIAALWASPNLSLDQPFSLALFVGAILIGLIAHFEFKTERARVFITSPNTLLSALLCLVLLLAAGLRFYGIDFGLPYNFHPDEVPKFNAIERMRAHGDLNPRYFLHPSILLYSTYFSNFVRQLLFPTPNWSETLILSGRIASASAGIASVYLTYLIGRRLFNPWAGIFGAAILAVSPLHITCSRYVKEDSILTFFILLTTYLVVRSAKDNKPKLLYLAGIAAGAAASTKYSGILAFFLLFGAPWIKSSLKSNSWNPDKTYLKALLFALIAVPVGFVLFSPYTVLDLQTFLADIASEKEHMGRGHMVTIDAWSQFWMYHFYRSIIPGISAIAGFLGVAGLSYLTAKRHPVHLYIVAAFLLFYLPAEFVNAKPAPQPERYILPTLPFLAIATGLFIEAIISRSRVLGFILILLSTTIPLYRSITLASEIYPDTRLQMRDWMIQNLPKGSTVVMDWKPYNPSFKEDEFKVIYIPREDIISNLRISNLKSLSADYIVLSSLYYGRFFDQPNAEPAFREVFRKVFSTFTTVKTFEANHGTYGFHNPKLTLLDLKISK